MIRIINTVFRVVVALVFIYSGFVKLVDPYGTAYKITDYVEILHIMLPLWLALSFAIILSVFEFTLGLNALFKNCYRNTTKLLFVVVSIFTVLTLYIAIKDPVQDCGCFGDALVISNWQTFFKNIVLLLMTLELVRNRNYLRRRVVQQNQKMMTVFFIVFAFLFAINAVKHLPILDFRPYSVGTYVPEKMQVPEGMPQDVYETRFVYEKNGEEQEFTEDNYPWQDTTWSYVSSESILVSKGAQAPIHDFVIEDSQMGDITEDVLYDNNYTFMLIAPYLDKCSLKHKDEIEDVVHFCKKNEYRFMVLTSTVGDGVKEYKSHFTTDFQVCNMDEITLKTIIRAHPGLVILKEGVILAKYHHVDLPEFSTSDNVLGEILSRQETQKNRIIILLLALLLGGVIFKLLQKKDYTK